MNNLLSTGKKLLIERAIELYNDRRDELEFEEYPDHYACLGTIIAGIDQVNSFPILISKIEKGEFESIGLFLDDEDMMEDFLRDVLRNL